MGAILADWGADVIKVEEPRSGDPIRGLVNALNAGDGPSPTMDIPNRGKRSMAIDLKSAEGLEIFHRLIKDADVFATNLRQSLRTKLKIDVEDLRAHNPRLVY